VTVQQFHRNGWTVEGFGVAVVVWRYADTREFSCEVDGIGECHHVRLIRDAGLAGSDTSTA
jgi:hypothetical protein